MRWRVNVEKKPVTAYTLNAFRCCCQRRSARTRVTVNRCAAIFEPPVPILYLSTVNKCDERKKHVGHKHTLCATQGVRSVFTAFREFVRDYWLRSYPTEANRVLWRGDINAGWKNGEIFYRRCT